MQRLSVIIPALNEQATLAEITAAVLGTGLVEELHIVNDGSTDATARICAGLAERHPSIVRVHTHAAPRGKGAAIRTALSHVQGEITLIQDADLEYSPSEYSALLKPFEDPSVHAVFGSRVLNRANPRFSNSFYWGGRLLSVVTSALFATKLTDEPTGYKVVRTRLMKSLALRRDGFEFCPELTGRLLRAGVQIHEVPISYSPRSRAAGKKIRFRDGIIAVGVLLRERFRKPVSPPVVSTTNAHE